MSIFPAISVIVFVNFLISVEKKPVVDCFVNKIFLSLDNYLPVIKKEQNFEDHYPLHCKSKKNFPFHCKSIIDCNSRWEMDVQIFRLIIHLIWRDGNNFIFFKRNIRICSSDQQF